MEQFSQDLTRRAAAGELDPVTGRDAELERIIEILCRRTKNNPVLLGEPGVGKTALAEALGSAHRRRGGAGAAEKRAAVVAGSVFGGGGHKVPGRV